jgi:hypothetical protein
LFFDSSTSEAIVVDRRKQRELATANRAVRRGSAALVQGASDAASSEATVIDSAQLITPSELARRLRVTVQCLSVWRWKNFGPPHLKVGGRVMYFERDVNWWLGSRRRASTAQPID